MSSNHCLYNEAYILAKTGKKMGARRTYKSKQEL